MASRSTSMPGSCVSLALSTMGFLVVGILLLGGRLFIVSDALSNQHAADLSPSEKIGLTFSSKPSMAIVASTGTGSPVPGEMRPPLLIEQSAPATRPAAPPAPPTAIVAPMPDNSVARDDPGASDQPATKSVRTGRGSSGCSQYRTLDPQVSTARFTPAFPPSETRDADECV
jgi:hypothetical protein